jgi:hypothetical protein
VVQGEAGEAAQSGESSSVQSSKVAMIRNATSKTSASPHGAAGRSSEHKLINVPVPGYVQARVEALMRDLRTQLPEDVLEAYIPALAEKFVYMIKPDPVIASKGDTADQLSKVKKHGNALLISILSLQGPAIDALHLRHPTLGEFETWLVRLVEVASHAEVPTTANGRRGMKPKFRASEIAEAAADDFYHLTGRAPGRTIDREDRKSKVSGGFIFFLEELFRVLGVVASADHYGKEAARVWKNKHASRTK